jgi:hypothetical protein
MTTTARWVEVLRLTVAGGEAGSLVPNGVG